MEEDEGSTALVDPPRHPCGFVYLWTNKVNGKRYIGSHIGSVDDGYTGSGTIYRRAVAKHGIENFERTLLEVLENCTREEVQQREQFHLDENDAAKNAMFYNLRAKVGGGFEHINSLPGAADRSRANLRKYGHLSSRYRGKKHSDETKAAQSTKSKRWMDENKSRPVWCFKLDGTIVQQYGSIQDAAAAVNGSPSNIKYTAEGKFKHAYGFIWSYTEEATPVDDPTAVSGQKAVLTPQGRFESVKAVMDHYGFTSTTQVRRRCLSAKWVDWQYEHQ